MRKSVVEEVLAELDVAREHSRWLRNPALKLAGAAALGAPVLTGLLQASTAHPAAAQPDNTYVVTTTSNTGAFATGVGACATGGPCSLQQAVNQFNADPSGASDTITFGQGGTLTLTAPLVIDNPFDNDLTIQGNGPSSTVINVGGFGIVVGTFGVGAKIEGVTITGSTGPSALQISGNGFVGLLNSVMTGNSESGGPGGGAVFNERDFYAAGDTFSGNTASLGGGGGAVLNFGTFLSANDTFSGNSASGGGLGGGAVLNDGGDFEGLWDTFSANSATGFGGVGGAVLNTNVTDIGGSVFAGNTPAVADNSTPACFGVTDEGYNVSDDASCISDPRSTVATDAQIGLAPLGSNGGPTPTESIPQSSPAAAIVAPSGDCTVGFSLPGVSNSSGQGIDQRGFLRPSSSCSAGAFQVNGVPPFSGGGAVPPSDPLNLALSDGPITLNWLAPVSSGTSPVTSYDVFRFTPTTAASQIATVSAPTTTYVDSSVVDGTQYCYYVQAVNTFGTSAPSNVACITPTSSPAPGPPGSSTSCTGSTGNGAFVCALYEDLLGRAPDPSGLASWQGALSSGASRSQVALAITSSQEYRSDLITGYYEKFLHRAPDPSGLATWLSAFGSGASDQLVIASILATPEFWADSGSTPSGFVTGLYENLLGRAPDPVGLADWETFVQAPGTSPFCPPGQPYCVTGGWLTAALGIMSSQEYFTDVVSSYYQSFLGRSPDPGGLAMFTSQLAAGATDEQVISEIVGSQEFYNDANAG